MRTSFVGSTMLAACIFLFAMTAAGQAPRAPAQAPAYRAPRTKDGKPDLNGIWQAVNSANWDIEGHGAAPGPFWQLGAEFSVPPGLGVVEGGPIPYKPEALQIKKENFADRMNRDPESKCDLPVCRAPCICP